MSQPTERSAAPHPVHDSGSLSRGVRETIEAIAIAFALAFLFKTFEAEAFVIPTGSMAPTLMGRHKDVTCPQCKFVYSVNASGEEGGGPAPLGIGGFRFRANAQARQGSRVVAGTCVNCRFQADLTGEPKS